MVEVADIRSKASPKAALDAPTVSQVASRIDGALRALRDGWIEGEVSSIDVHRASGHIYLTLADEGANLDACIWRGRVSACQPLPKQGELVQAHYERVSFYAPRGSTKLVIDRLRPTGEGELLRRRAQTLARLRAAGLCDPDRRKPLPAFPRRVGVIAARSDANIDVIQALRKRFPPQDVLFCPASVQGVRAVGSIIDALGRLQAVEDVDVIVLARGGGSTADLVPFDDERLCRAIFACAVPVITSIGHTKDRPNCDRVAAAFAPVPAKAAELAISRSAIELLDELDGHRRALADIWRRSQALRDAVSHSWSAARPRRSLVSKADELVRLGELLRSKAQIDLQRRETCLTSDVRGLGLAMRRAPRASAVEELGRDLIRRAEARSAGQARDVEEIARRLHDAASLARHVSGLEVSSARLQAAHGRLTRKLLDLRAAMERRSAEGRRELRRNLNLCLQQVDREAQRLRPVADRILERACERVEALAAITRAKDFRARGWVMATDIAGKPIRGVATLSKEQKLRLCFADGEAAATITDITQGEMT